MPNLNKVMLMGRLTRDPEVKEFANGGKVAHIGFAVNNRRRSAETGAWEDVPVWLELKAYNRDTGRKTADLAQNHLHKGMPVYVEGHLALEEWEGKDDGKRHSKTLVYVDHIEFLGSRREGSRAEGHAGEAAAEGAQPAAAHNKRSPARRGGPGAKKDGAAPDAGEPGGGESF
jgi:single-strand DNA-binding protein